jgi:SAM-dependent methyltransferase
LLGLQKGERPFLYSFWIRKLGRLIPKGSKILEVGCGLGYFLKWLDKKYTVYGIDISEDAITIARDRTKASLRIADAQDLPFKDVAFNGIIAFDIIEHLENPEKFFREAYRVLLTDGLLILSTPNPDSFGSRIKSKKPKDKGFFYKQQHFDWFGWRDDTHINIKSIDEWRNLLNDNGFIILKDGSDTLWDVPYFRCVPNFIQKFLFMPAHWMFIWLFGFFRWKYGENYICIAKKII